jgi:acyl dehydratase
MPIDYAHLKAWQIPETAQTYTPKDCIIYALGLGFGDHPTDPEHLKFLYERDLQAFPSMAVVLAMGGSWTANPATGIDYTQLLHAEQSFELHRPLPTKGDVVGRSKVVEVIDKGAGRGAIAISQRDLFIDGEATPTASLRSSAFCRANGGFGGPVTESPKAHPVPARPADGTFAIKTLRQAALLYRLSGDANPLHADPAVAAAAGFPEPILHGLCTFGTAIRSALAAAGVPASSVTAGGARFTAPVFPGETLETEIWREGQMVTFRTTVVDRAKLALNNGWLRVT